jgi:pyridoxine 5-phosphate synthase
MRLIKPDYVTLVPERREEVTTEGGLDIVGQLDRLKSVVDRLQSADIPVSLFIDPESAQIDASAQIEAQFIELNCIPDDAILKLTRQIGGSMNLLI